MTRCLLPVLLAAGMLAGSVPAAAAPAEPSVRDRLAPAPQALFDEATRLYKAGDAMAARAGFERAYAASGEPRVLFNVAVCEKAMGHYARAIAALEKSLATEPPPSSAYRAHANEALTTLRAFVAKVHLDATPPDASFVVDGAPASGDEVLLELGAHTVTARKAGFEPANQLVTVRTAEPLRVHLDLVASKEPGSVRVTCPAAPGCEVRVGEEMLGPAPVVFRRQTGTYVVRATVRGRLLATRQVSVVDGTAQDVELEGSLPPRARLRVTTDRFDDVVSVDGARAGRSGAEIELAPGEHRVLVSRADGRSRALDVLLHDDETRDLRFPLDGSEPRSHAGWWIAGAAGAAVVVGAVVTGIVLATRPTHYEGNNAGTLNPFVVPASVAGTR